MNLSKKKKAKQRTIFQLVEMIILISILCTLFGTYQREIIQFSFILSFFLFAFYQISAKIQFTDTRITIKQLFSSSEFHKNRIQDYEINEMIIGYKLCLTSKSENNELKSHHFYLWNLSWIKMFELIQQLEEIPDITYDLHTSQIA
ncbi:MAG: hypothetical protein RBT46_06040 [Weeksellaceae bacterium]|jgi:hypothetical protein|nr:hypothetical protein [Weeksellaceae bacterium]MDX9705251.1 hypothetical protein [Weeksellaceae bacterium]